MNKVSIVETEIPKLKMRNEVGLSDGWGFTEFSGLGGIDWFWTRSRRKGVSVDLLRRSRWNRLVDSEFDGFGGKLGVDRTNISECDLEAKGKTCSWKWKSLGTKAFLDSISNSLYPFCPCG